MVFHHHYKKGFGQPNKIMFAISAKINNKGTLKKGRSALFFFPSSDNPCKYKNLEFRGGDLSVIPSLGFESCKEQCEKLQGCAFFTINRVACILKDGNVEIRRKIGVISGATDQTCGKSNKI